MKKRNQPLVWLFSLLLLATVSVFAEHHEEAPSGELARLVHAADWAAHWLAGSATALPSDNPVAGFLGEVSCDASELRAACEEA